VFGPLFGAVGLSKQLRQQPQSRKSGKPGSSVCFDELAPAAKALLGGSGVRTSLTFVPLRSLVIGSPAGFGLNLYPSVRAPARVDRIGALGNDAHVARDSHSAA